MIIISHQVISIKKSCNLMTELRDIYWERPVIISGNGFYIGKSPLGEERQRVDQRWESQGKYLQLMICAGLL